MSWDKKYYNACKKHMAHLVSHHPWCYEGGFDEWLTTWVQFVKKIADDGDYEAAQASKDAIIEYAEKILKRPIPKETMLIFKTPDRGQRL
jgi:hypothetical protein